MSTPANCPPSTAAAVLGYGGLAPFVLLSGACVFGGPYLVLWSHALLGYGAIILSFVGALHWAFAMSWVQMGPAWRQRRMIWSIIPALLGWAALVLLPAAASALLIAGFLTQYIQDRLLMVSGVLPPWFLPLRLRLTLVACFCLGLAGFYARY